MVDDGEVRGFCAWAAAAAKKLNSCWCCWAKMTVESDWLLPDDVDFGD